MKFLIPNDIDTIRLDQYLVEKLATKSRSFIQNLIKNGHCLVNGLAVKTGYILKPQDEITLDIPDAKPLDLTPVEMKLDVIYEDAYLMVINKPKGLVVHPSSSYHEPTLVHGLLHQTDDLSGINGVLRPGIVHRIDKDTTGLLIVAKTDEAHQKLSDMFKTHEIKRSYQAICYGHFKNEDFTIDAPIGRDPNNRLKMGVHKEGKRAVTHVHVLSSFEEYSHINVELETGRTHQIRVHMAFIKHPIVGDPLYGPKHVIGDSGQFLHAYKLTFTHPIKNEQMTFEVDLPTEFTSFLASLK